LLLLRTAYRRQRRKATLTALGYFVVFLLLSAFVPSLMTVTVSGGVSIGLLLGLCQLPAAGLALWLYERDARLHIDPVTARLSEGARPRTGRATIQ
jgi:uncharacterized membrane protein (DUF485 family)